MQAVGVRLIEGTQAILAHKDKDVFTACILSNFMILIFLYYYSLTGEFNICKLTVETVRVFWLKRSRHVTPLPGVLVHGPANPVEHTRGPACAGRGCTDTDGRATSTRTGARVCQTSLFPFGVNSAPIPPFSSGDLPLCRVVCFILIYF